VDYGYEVVTTAADTDPTKFDIAGKYYKLKSVDYGTTINDIMSYVIPEDTEDIYGCGYAWLSPANFEEDIAPDFKNTGTIASFFGMEARGDLNFVFQLGGTT
jgi:hypothetical protein